MQRCTREDIAAVSEEFDKTLPQEGWLTAGHAERGMVWINQADQGANFIDAVGVVNISGRLRTH